MVLYLQYINLNWKILTKNKAEFPLVREVPSAHVIPFMTPHASYAVPCLMKCVHREFIDGQTGLSLKIVMNFEPLQPIIPAATPASSASVATPNSAFEHDLPLADDTDASTSEFAEGEFVADDNGMEEYFPDVPLSTGDETFLEELLAFARAEDSAKLM